MYPKFSIMYEMVDNSSDKYYQKTNKNYKKASLIVLKPF